MTHWPRHGRIAGPIVMIGFGSIGKGTLPLIERHFEFDKERFVVIDPDDSDRKLLDERGVGFVHLGLTRDNYRDVLSKYLTAGGGPGLLRQPLGRHLLARHHAPLPRDRRALHRHRRRALAGLLLRQVARKRGAHQLRACARRCWPSAARIRAARPPSPAAAPIRAWSPGSSSRRSSISPRILATRLPSRRRRTSGAVSLSASASRACISPNATPSAPKARSRATCSSTPGRSKASCRKACSRPNSAGARTRNGRRRTRASTRQAAARRSTSTSPAPTRACAHGRRRPGLSSASSSPTTSRSRSPTITRCATSKGEAVYRPTCHYAYHPCDDAVLSLHELFGRAGEIQSAHHILGEAEILDGIDELGVLLYGHARNAYWYGSQLSVEETRALAPYQNATGMQVTSAVLAGMVWALENPNAGHRRGRRTGLPPLPREFRRPI